MVVHLATVNNHHDLDEQAYYAGNVDLLQSVARATAKAGVPRLLNVSSVHVLDAHNQTAYARSKREGVRQLNLEKGALHAETVYLPLVYSDLWGGRLAILNRLPRFLGRGVFYLLAALKPTVNVNRLADLIIAGLSGTENELIILSEGQGSNLAFRALKRLVDLAFAVAILLFLWWVLAIVWAVIRLNSPGPALFRQARVGRHGRLFTCYKFRTMRQGTAQAGTHQVAASAVTGKLGEFLRRTKLDELPQVWNILRNEISLVGPRPCLPVQVELIEARRRRGVLEAQPGITGLAQIEGIDMSDPERLARKDAEYVRLQSLVLDLKILLGTALGRGQGDKIVRPT